MSSGSGSSSRRPQGIRRDGTPTASGVSTPNETLDLYRPLANQVSRPLQSLLSSSSSDASSSALPNLLSLSRTAYSSKVHNKALNFAPSGLFNTDESKAVRGKKKHRGDPESHEAARRSAEEKKEARRKLAIPNRGKRKRAVLDAGSELSYDRLRPLHHLNTIYLSNLLNLPPASEGSPAQLSLSADMMQSKLSKADFTGASLTVASARNASLIGLSGLVIEETASTFRLLTPKSIVKVIPKNGTLFHLSFPATAHPQQAVEGEGRGSEPYQSTIMPIPSDTMDRYLSTTPRVVIPLLGTNFGFRSGDRAGRKFRPTQGGGGGSGWGEEWVKGEWSDVLDLLQDSADGESSRSKRDRAGSESGKPIKRRRGKARRKDPPAFGALQVS